jgi:hypothetical protein
MASTEPAITKLGNVPAVARSEFSMTGIKAFDEEVKWLATLIGLQ